MVDEDKQRVGVLTALSAVQFFAWSAMFALWVQGLPLVGAIFSDVRVASQSGNAPSLLAVCFAIYLTLATALAFMLPQSLRRLDAGLLLGLLLLVGAAGFLVLSIAHGVTSLILGFVGIAFAWTALSNLPYAMVGAVAPPGGGARLMRLFALSTVVPQIVTMVAVVALERADLRISPASIMFAAGLAMGLGAFIAIMCRKTLDVALVEW